MATLVGHSRISGGFGDAALRDGQEASDIADDDFMVTRTDTDGKIRYVNDTLVRISGFSMNELLGASSQVLYHPDMPEEVGKDLWKSLADRGSWTGVMKHRRRDGGHFWAVATVTRTWSDGKHVGHTTVRTRASRAQIAAASVAYARLKDGRRGFSLREGRIRRAGFSRLCGWFNIRALAVRWNLCMLLIAASAACIAIDAAIGVPLASILRAGAPIVSLGAALALLWSIRRSVDHTTRACLAASQQLGAGDLGWRVSAADPADEAGKLLFSLGVMQKSLLNTIRDANSSAESVHSVSLQVAASSAQLSARTEQQVAALEESAAEVEEMAAQVQQNAADANNASQLAHEALGMVRHGIEAIADVQAAIEKMSSTANKVSHILSTIESIAFQTNILALNAAVEAARAGASGRGFAVVAADVRDLAQRSASAAREIKDINASSTQYAAEGVRQVERASTRMQDILERVGKASQLATQIATASNEQMHGINGLSSAINQIDNSNQKNAQMVEETVYAANVLRDASERLAQAIRTFRLGKPQPSNPRVSPMTS